MAIFACEPCDLLGADRLSVFCAALVLRPVVRSSMAAGVAAAFPVSASADPAMGRTAPTAVAAVILSRLRRFIGSGIMSLLEMVKLAHLHVRHRASLSCRRS